MSSGRPLVLRSESQLSPLSALTKGDVPLYTEYTGGGVQRAVS